MIDVASVVQISSDLLLVIIYFHESYYTNTVNILTVLSIFFNFVILFMYIFSVITDCYLLFLDDISLLCIIRVVSILVTYRTHKLVAYVLLCILYNKIVPILKN